MHDNPHIIVHIMRKDSTMPNPQFIQQLREEREVHQSVIGSIDRLLTFYDAPVASGGVK
jgi:hypothetical protein